MRGNCSGAPVQILKGPNRSNEASARLSFAVATRARAGGTRDRRSTSEAQAAAPGGGAGERRQLRARRDHDRRAARARCRPAATRRAASPSSISRGSRRLNRRGPELRAVIDTNPDALADRGRARRGAQGRQGARAAARDSGAARRPTSAPPTRLQTTAGSLALEHWSPPEDAFIAGRLRAAGAILLGKSNMSEWAGGRGTRTHRRLERYRRPVPQSLCARSQSAGIEFGFRRRALRELLHGRRRHRHRRLGHLSGVRQRRLRHAADDGIAQPRGNHSVEPDVATRRDRWRGPSATRRSCSAAWSASIRKTP